MYYVCNLAKVSVRGNKNKSYNTYPDEMLVSENRKTRPPPKIVRSGMKIVRSGIIVRSGMF